MANGGNYFDFPPNNQPNPSIGGVQQPFTSQGGGFGEYFRSMPAWLAIGALANKPLDFLQGYQNFKQQSATTDMFRKFDQLLISDPEIKNADWSDPSFGRKVQKLAIERGVPGYLVDDLLDQYHINIDDKGTATAMYYDTESRTIVAHQQIEPGKIITGERYARVDLDKAKDNKIYRNWLVQTYPGIKPWVEDALGTVGDDKKALADFRKRYESEGAEPLIKELGIDVFMSIHGKAYNREYKPLPEAIRRQYDSITKNKYSDEYTEEEQNIVNTVNETLNSLLEASNEETTKEEKPLPQYVMNQLDRLTDEQYRSLAEKAVNELKTIGVQNPTQDDVNQRMIKILGQIIIQQMQQR